MYLKVLDPEQEHYSVQQVKKIKVCGNLLYEKNKAFKKSANDGIRRRPKDKKNKKLKEQIKCVMKNKLEEINKNKLIIEKPQKAPNIKLAKYKIGCTFAFLSWSLTQSKNDNSKQQ